jgi:hypothetical protein
LRLNFNNNNATEHHRAQFDGSINEEALVFSPIEELVVWSASDFHMCDILKANHLGHS